MGDRRTSRSQTQAAGPWGPRFKARLAEPGPPSPSGHFDLGSTNPHRQFARYQSRTTVLRSARLPASSSTSPRPGPTPVGRRRCLVTSPISRVRRLGRAGVGLAVAVLVVAGASTYAFARTRSDDNVINACYKTEPGSGQLRI